MHTRAIKAINGFCCYLGLVFAIVTFTPITLWWGEALAGFWSRPDGDVLIVLGADEPVDGIIGQSSYWRTIYAWRAWKSGHFKKVVLSGGHGIAISMKELLVYRGVPTDLIEIESHSTSTRENALFARALLSNTPGTKVLLTSDYHMFRARRTFEKLGVQVIPHPFPDVLKQGNHLGNRCRLFLLLISETTKTAGYWIKGWI